MSNKFNEYGSGGDGGDATNGSLDIWGYSLRATNMDNNSSIKTNSIGQLISSNLNISDVNNLQNELDLTIQNPNNSVLVTDGLTVTTGNILKTDEIHESTLGTNINLANDLYTNNIIVTGGNEIKTNNIGEASAGGGMNILSNVDMSAKEIQNCELIKVDSIQSKNLTDDVVCGSNLDMFVKNIKNVNDINSVNVLCDNIKEKTVAGGINILNNVDMNLKTLNNASNVETSSLTAQGVSTFILAPNAIFNPSTIFVSGILDMSSNNITNINNLQTQEIKATDGVSVNYQDDINMGLFDINNCNDIRVNALTTNTAPNIVSNNSIDMNTNDLLDVGNMNISTINSLTPVGGIYSGISDGVVINQASGTTDLLPISSVGGLLIPANGFKVGDAFHLVCSGIFPSENKNDDVLVELRATLANTSVVVLGSILIGLENFNTRPSNFELESDFVIRSVGVSGKVAVSFDFTFNKKITEDFKGTRKTNLATLDTTQSSRLSLNATIIGGSGSSIKSTMAYLRKQY